MAEEVKDRDMNLHATMDANAWASEFSRIWAKRMREVDFDTMRAWFANAIMCGYDHGRRAPNEELELARHMFEAVRDWQMNDVAVKKQHCGWHMQCVQCDTMFRLRHEGEEQSLCPSCRMEACLADYDAKYAKGEG